MQRIRKLPLEIAYAAAIKINRNWYCNFRVEGWRGYYKGMSPYLLHVTPNICIVFLLYETITTFAREYRLKAQAELAAMEEPQFSSIREENTGLSEHAKLSGWHQKGVDHNKDVFKTDPDSVKTYGDLKLGGAGSVKGIVTCEEKEVRVLDLSDISSES